MKLPENQHLAEITKRLRTSSAVVPSLLFAAIALPTGAAGLMFGKENTQPVFIGILLLPMLLTFGQIVFFTIFDRDRLQNEDHVERKMLIGQARSEMGDANSVIELETGGKLIGNPAVEGDSDV
ncbi:hypothetical protein [Allosphingosinicella sp.]|jgi:hypothetical protein|uniref:hypothetical protein n=1 Tax=Allosphingosinicella sp. TaxID=2823234 RepID=UPI002F112739